MKVQVWLSLVPGADRVYAQTYAPTPARYEAVKRNGGEIHLVEVDIPGWKVEDSIIPTVAKLIR